MPGHRHPPLIHKGFDFLECRQRSRIRVARAGPAGLRRVPGIWKNRERGLGVVSTLRYIPGGAIHSHITTPTNRKLAKRLL